MAENIAKYQKTNMKPDNFDDENFVRVPIEIINEKSEPVREFRTYKIIKRLDH